MTDKNSYIIQTKGTSCLRNAEKQPKRLDRLLSIETEIVEFEVNK